ncbi:alpha/beta hydrolase [Micromonospora sp. R77]|uniref:alpha/beta hydrolase family protein n=1 Tax=Micromonospora sp. R77 TaxID=2925836 RepID=UPI001F615549|nr:alpha/beta fold hydrolase [Micromonospora sp. R77]MCI4062868.1 alpha/beta hydrolase [Micromonospora sp. R77]
MSTERELVFTSGPFRLAGTLTVPDGGGPHPGVLLLPGSGPLDRDGNHRRLPLGISRDLATALATAGIAALRYDRRGVGASSGRFLRTGFHDNVDDAAAALAALTAAGEVDPERLFLVGHSEGALTATALAARGGPVAGLVLLAGTGRPGTEALRWQAARLLPSLPAPVRLLLRLTRTDLVAKVARNHEKILATTGDVARVGGRRVNARWFREFLSYDPRPDLARIHAPVLALTGDKDLQVDPADLAVIAANAGGPVETLRLPDVTHVLRRQPGTPSLRAYRTEVRQPVDPSVTDSVMHWLTARSR